MRHIIFSFLGLLAFLLGVAIVVPFFVSLEDYKDQIILKAKESIGRDVTIDGKMSIQLLPNPQLSIEKVGINNVPGGSTEKLINIKAVKIAVQLFPLFKKQIKVNTVQLDEPEIFLEKLPNGQPNWNLDILSTSTSTSTPSFDVTLDKMRIRKGRVTYHEAKKDFEISHINVIGKLDSLQGPYEVSGDFKVYGQEINFETKLGKLEESQDVSLKVTAGESTSILEGKVSLMPLAFKGNLKISADSKMLKIISATDKASPSLPETLHVEGNLVADETSISFTKAEFDLGTAHPTGSIKLLIKDAIQLDGQLVDLPGHGQCIFSLLPSPDGLGGTLNASVTEAKEFLTWLQVDTKSFPPEVKGPVSLSTQFTISNVIKLHDLNLNVQEAKLQGDISWQLQKENPLLIVDLRTPKFENVIKLMGVKNPQTLGMSHLKGHLQWGTNSLKLTHLKGQLGSNFSFAGDILIDQAAQKPKIKAILSLNPINLATLTASREMNQTFNPEAHVRLISLNRSPAGTKWSHAPLDFSFLTKFDGQFDITASKLTQKDIVVVHPKLRANLQNGRLDISSFTGSIFQGSLTGKGYITSDNYIQLHLALSDANLKDLPTQGSNIKIIGGKFSMALDLSTHGKSMDELVRHIDGPINITAQNGIINGFDLHTLSQRLGNLQDPRSLIGLLTTSMGKGQTPFTNFKGNLSFKDGIGTIQSMTLVAPDGEGHASGHIDLPQYYLNIQANFRLIQHPNLPTFHMQLVGPIDNPSRNLDTAALQKYMIDNVFKGVIGKLGKGKLKAGDVLGAILGSNKESSQQQSNNNSPQSIKPEQIVKDIFKGIF